MYIYYYYASCITFIFHMFYLNLHFECDFTFLIFSYSVYITIYVLLYTIIILIYTPCMFLHLYKYYY